MNTTRVIKNRVMEMFTEDNGKLSLSRVTSGLMVLSTIVWVTYLVFKTTVLPELTGPAVFASGGAAHYGLAKWFGKKDGDPVIPGALSANSAPPDVKLTPGTDLPKSLRKYAF